MKIRVLTPYAMPSVDAASGDVVEVDEAAGSAYVAAGFAEETSDKVGPAPEAVLLEPEPITTEAEVEPEAVEESEVIEDVEDTGTGEYEGRTRLQLVQVARNRGIRGAARMSKDELIEALRG